MIPISLIVSKLMGTAPNVITTNPGASDVSMKRMKLWKNTNVPQASDPQPSKKTGTEYHSDDGTGRLTCG